MRYRHVVFDLDGTLVDSLPDIAAALNHGLRVAGLLPFALHDVRAFVGDGVRALVTRALAARAPSEPQLPAADRESVTANLLSYYLEHPSDVGRCYPGIPETLAELRTYGASLSLLTNKPAPVARALLRALRLDAFFAGVVGDGDGYPRKPDPAALAWLVRGLTPAEVLMVGDGLADLHVAAAFGCDSAACAWGYTAVERLVAAGPTHVLAHPADLARVVAAS